MNIYHASHYLLSLYSICSLCLRLKIGIRFSKLEHGILCLSGVIIVYLEEAQSQSLEYFSDSQSNNYLFPTIAQAKNLGPFKQSALSFYVN